MELILYRAFFSGMTSTMKEISGQVIADNREEAYSKAVKSAIEHAKNITNNGRNGCLKNISITTKRFKLKEVKENK